MPNQVSEPTGESEGAGICHRTDAFPIIEESQLHVLSFRKYRVYPGARRLFHGRRSIELGGRAFDLLIVLLEARGKVVPKEQLLRDVWPATIVDESNLRFQMVLLRRALGKDRELIKTVSGRGYLFAYEIDDARGCSGVGSLPNEQTSTAISFNRAQDMEGGRKTADLITENSTVFG